jgi:spore maturation protein SpmA
MDERNLDGWLMLLEIAEQAGHTEMIGDIMQTLKQIAPDDPRVIGKVALSGLSWNIGV